MNKIIHGDSQEELKKLQDNSIDTIITDPPYGLSFMGKKWDYDVPSVELWQECLRVLKPGGTALIFAGSRTQHRMAVNIEDAGFELKDTIMWLYGSGFPKAADISKQLQKQSGKEPKIVGKNPNHRNKENYRGTLKDMNQHTGNGNLTEPTDENAKLWSGWKSHGLKPAYEPIIVAMKPNEGSYAQNALKNGVSGLNIDGARVGENPGYKYNADKNGTTFHGEQGARIKQSAEKKGQQFVESTNGRFPANIIFECICDEVIIEPTETKEPEEVKGGIWSKSEGKPAGRTYKGGNQIHTNPNCPCYMLDEQSGTSKTIPRPIADGKKLDKDGNWGFKRMPHNISDKGGASRFFYVAKASKAEKNIGCEDLEEKRGGSMVANISDKMQLGGASLKGNNKEIQSTKNFHPTVKPIKLMEYLCMLTKTPTSGIVLDPFAGSGTTGIACVNTGRDYILIEREEEYIEIIKARLKITQNKLI